MPEGTIGTFVMDDTKILKSSTRLDPPRVGVERVKIAAIGHSHLGALVQAIELKEQEGAHFRFLSLLDPDLISESGVDGAPRLLSKIGEIVQDADVVALSISGNEHHMLGLVRSDRPFDFIPPNGRYRATLADHELLPFSLVYETMKSVMRTDLFDAMSGKIPLPVIVIGPPPPILDEGHLRRHPGVFAQQIEEFGVGSPTVRHKLWQICSDITQKCAEAAGFQYLPAPEDGMGPEGFLHASALINDPTHANAWYGRLLIRDLMSFALKARI